MFGCMSTDETETDEIETEADVDSPDKETVKSWVKEAIEDLLSQVPGERVVNPKAEPEAEAPATIKEIEKAAREAVEAAMGPLREAIEAKPKPKPKPKAKPAPEPEPQPSTGQTVNRLRSFLWGDQ